jgi:hypothetical protein
MTEGVIVLPVFIIITAIGLYMWRSNLSHQALRENSRRQVWNQTLLGCGAGGDPDLSMLDIIATLGFDDRARANVNAVAKFLDTVRVDQREATLQSTVRRDNHILGGEDSSILSATFRNGCNEVKRNTVSAVWPAMLATLCRQGACSYDCECTPGATQCLGDKMQRVCISYDDCGVWNKPSRCGGTEEEPLACMVDQCEPCDPNPDDGLLTDLPLCPPSMQISPEEPPP